MKRPFVPFVCLSLGLFVSLGAFANTNLDKKNLTGEYLIQAKDVYMVAHIVLGSKNATMKYQDTAGDVSCKGTYAFDEKTQTVKTKFQKCGYVNISHTVYLEGQTLESLAEGAKVMISLEVDGESVPAIEFTMTKLK